MNYELRTEFRLGAPIGDYIGSWVGPIKGYTTHLVQGSYVKGLSALRSCVCMFVGLGMG